MLLINQAQHNAFREFRYKFKVRQMIRSRPLLLHLMLKQGQTLYPLSNV